MKMFLTDIGNKKVAYAYNETGVLCVPFDATTLRVSGVPINRMSVSEISSDKIEGYVLEGMEFSNIPMDVIEYAFQIEYNNDSTWSLYQSIGMAADYTNIPSSPASVLKMLSESELVRLESLIKTK